MLGQPVGGPHPAFESWLERRRKRIQAQMSALDEERYHDLVHLIGGDDEDRPPEPRTAAERDEYRRMLEDSRKLTERMLRVRGKILEELRDMERRRQRLLPGSNRSSRGGSLDGYL